MLIYIQYITHWQMRGERMAIFIENLRSSVLKSFKHMGMINSTVIHTGGWDNQSARTLTFLLNEQVVTKVELLNIIDERLKTMGRSCFNQHQQGTYPDHTLSPAAFAYALEQGEFTEEEELKIKFDHDENKQKFIRSYGIEDVCQRTMEVLLTEKMESLDHKNGSFCEGCD